MRYYLTCIALIALGVSLSWGQYGYVRTSGWKAYLAHENDKDIVCLSVASDSNSLPYVIIDSFSNTLKIQESDSLFKATDSVFHAMWSSFSIDYLSNSVYWSGATRNMDTLFYQATVFDGQSKQYKEYISDKSNLALAQYIDSDDTILLTYSAIEEKNKEIGRTRVIMNGEYVPSIFRCNNASNDLGCRLIPIQIEKSKTEKKFYILGRAGNVWWRDHEPCLIKIDSNGNKEWQIYLTNDSVYYMYPAMTMLSNGNVLIACSDKYWKTNKRPPDFDNSDPQPNYDATTWLIEVSPEGKVVKKIDLKHELNFNEFYRGPEMRHMSGGKHGCSYFVGYAYTDKRIGFVMKLDSIGNFVWLRNVQLDLHPDATRQELYLEGVAERQDGGLILTGEYKAYAGSSGLIEQTGILILTDSFGCQTPNCQLTDGIYTPRALEERFTVSPNPTNGSIEVKNIRKKFNISKYNYQLVSSDGTVLAEGKLESRLKINHQAGMYFLRIYDDSGYWQVLKVSVVQ